jgi:hypothetical protein
MACITRPATKQDGATCWFHAILNGFITSKYGQVIMYKALAKYMYEHVATKKEYEDFASSDLTCVMPGKLHSKFNFYKWLYHWLVIGLPAVRRNTRNAMKNLVNAKRGNLNERHQHPAVALFQILGRMDIKSFLAFNLVTQQPISPPVTETPDFWVFAVDTLSPNVKQGGFGAILPEILEAPQFGTGIYRLDHMCIGISLAGAGSHSGHAITGIRCAQTGAYQIIDSNIDFIFPCDWRQIDNVANNYAYRAACAQVYQAVPTNPLIFFVTYVRANIDTNTLNMNKLNIRPEKIIQKHMNAMNE